MKKFEMPEIMVEVFAIEDVITTSTGNSDEELLGPNDTPVF